MLAANIEREVKEILEKKGRSGWLRVQQCANEYAKELSTRELNNSRKTKFYRWRKQVEKGRVEGFKIQLLPGNVSFIGLSHANPEVLSDFISENKKTSRNVESGIGFFTWLDKRDERKRLEREQAARLPSGNELRLLGLGEHLESIGVAGVNKQIEMMLGKKRYKELTEAE